MIRHHSRILLLLCLMMAAVTALAKRPNIIVFLTDDQDKESLGAYGGEVWTPTLDRFAEEGMVFHNAFVTSTVCTPSRYAFLTGRYAGRSSSAIYEEECPPGQQAFPAFNMGLEPDSLNMGAMLSQAGYRTGFVGKYHVSGIEGLRNGQDYADNGLKYVERNAKAGPAVQEAFAFNELQYRRMLTDRGFDWAKNIYFGNLEKPYAEHNLEWTIEAALEFIGEGAGGGKPFYLQFCTTLVHGPDGSWSRGMREPLYSGSGMLDQEIFPEGMPTRREILAGLERRGLNADRGHAGYTWIDAGMAAILNKLEKLGIDQDTLIIFTSDHGSRQKASLFDVDGACVPFMVRWPGVVKGGVESDTLIQSIDIAATAYDLAGAELPEDYHLDGMSLVPLLKGETPVNWRDHVYIELGFGRAIRTEDFKYISIRYPVEHVRAVKRAQPEKLPQMLAPLNRSGIGVRGADNPNFYFDDALFHVARDKGELNNLVDRPEYRSKLQEMRRLLTETILTTGRPYGEFVPGGNALGPGQLTKQQEMARTMKIQGKNVTLPEDLR